MFTMRELQRRATVAGALVILVTVPLACPITKVIMEWNDRRKQAGPDHGHDQMASIA